MSGGLGGGAHARVRIKGRKASVVRFFFLAVAHAIPWIVLLSQMAYYSKLYGPQVLLQLNIAYYLPSIPTLLLMGYLEPFLDEQLGATPSIAVRLAGGLLACAGICAAWPFLPGRLVYVLWATVLLGAVSSVAFSVSYQLVAWFRSADTIALGIGAVGSGPISLIIQIALQIGPRPARWQWVALFEVAAGFVLLGLAAGASLLAQYWGILTGRVEYDEGRPLLEDAAAREAERREDSVQQMLLTPAATVFTLAGIAGDYAGAGGWADLLAPGELTHANEARLRTGSALRRAASAESDLAFVDWRKWQLDPSTPHSGNGGGGAAAAAALVGRGAASAGDGGARRVALRHAAAAAAAAAGASQAAGDLEAGPGLSGPPSLRDPSYSLGAWLAGDEAAAAAGGSSQYDEAQLATPRPAGGATAAAAAAGARSPPVRMPLSPRQAAARAAAAAAVPGARPDPILAASGAPPQRDPMLATQSAPPGSLEATSGYGLGSGSETGGGGGDEGGGGGGPSAAPAPAAGAGGLNPSSPRWAAQRPQQQQQQQPGLLQKGPGAAAGPSSAAAAGPPAGPAPATPQSTAPTGTDAGEEAGVAAVTLEVLQGTWQVVLAALVSSTLLNCVFPFFTYLPSSGLLGERLPSWLFYGRIMADIAGRLAPRRRELLVSSPGVLLAGAAGTVAVGVAFFVYLQAPSSLLYDPLALALVVVLWAMGGYINTISYILAPGLVHPKRATKASALMALTYQVAHIVGLMCATAIALGLYGDISGDL